MKVRLVVLACIAMLALGACSGGGSSSDAAKKAGSRIDTHPTLPAPANGLQGSAKACATVTQTQANNLFGNQATSTPDPSGGTGATSTCVWKFESNPGSTTQNTKYVLQARIYPGTSYYDAEKKLGGKSVKGVGQKANVRSNTSTLTLSFVKNGQTVVIEYSILGFQGTAQKSPKDQQAAVVKIGKQAASRV